MDGDEEKRSGSSDANGNTQTNSDAYNKDKPMRPELRKVRAQERIGHFTWAWFACTMSTGAVAVILGQLPFRFHGLNAIGKIFFILDLVLFIFFCCLIGWRFKMKPIVAIRSLHHPTEALFFGSFWVSVSLILTNTQIYGVPACGPWLPVALRVCFWIYAACAFCVGVFQYATLFVAERLSLSSAMPAWVFPAYPFLVIGPLAGSMLPDQPHHSAVAIFIGALMMQGLGWVVSMFMMTIYVGRLMSSAMPPPPGRPGMYISVGPVGYTSAALVSLGNQAPEVLTQNFLGTRADLGGVLKILGFSSGVFLWLLSFWFFCLSTVAILAGANRMKFTLNWWAFVFPNAGMTLALIQIGKALKNDAIDAVTCAMAAILVLLWIFVAISHILAIGQKRILWDGMDEDADMDTESKFTWRLE